MKSLVAFLAATLVAPAALACPGSHACGTCGGGFGFGFGSYVSAVSVGLLIGVGSVALENLIRQRR
ncbi:MAG TPA: hypothetical protein VLM85_25765, partial [Polyangiaceae bacterium]|nr:hypothetical protein [Polyangiaceae bacterium]